MSKAYKVNKLLLINSPIYINHEKQTKKKTFISPEPDITVDHLLEATDNNVQFFCTNWLFRFIRPQYIVGSHGY